MNKHGEKITSNKKSKERGKRHRRRQYLQPCLLFTDIHFLLFIRRMKSGLSSVFFPHSTRALSSLISIDKHNIRSHRRLLLTDQVWERQLLRIESSNKRHMIYEHARARETNPINSDPSESPRKSGEIPDFWV